MVSVDSSSAQVMEQVIVENGGKKEWLFPAIKDEQDGIKVRPEPQLDPEEFHLLFETPLVIVENGPKRNRLLPAVNDEHGGVIVEVKVEEENMDPNEFRARLKASLFQWKLQVYYYHCIFFLIISLIEFIWRFGSWKSSLN